MKQRLINKKGVESELAEELAEDWKKYLKMLVRNPGRRYVVSDPIDEIGHQHFLFTEEFDEFCKQVGGRFEHRPIVSEEEGRQPLWRYQAMTIPTMELLFGKISEHIWPRNHCVCTWMYVPSPAA